MSQTLSRRGPALVARPWLIASVLLAACVGDPAALPGTTADESPEPPGSLRGQLTVHMLSFPDGAEIQHVLKLDSAGRAANPAAPTVNPGETRMLRFPDPAPELTSGSTLRVWGDDDGQTIGVRRHELLPGREAEGTGVGGLQRALINGPKKPAKKWGFVLVDTGAGVNLTKQAAMDRLFSDNPTSIRSYYREVSYGSQDLSGDVLGPFTYTASAASLCQNFSGVLQQVGPMLTGNYDQYLWYFGRRITGCPWGGVAVLGSAERFSQHSFYNASSECVVLVQEPGHNFGMVHSSSLACTRGGQNVSMVATGDGGSCSHNEYGNPFDPMGGGGGGSSQQMLNTCYHMNGVQKAYQDWLGGCNIVKVTSSGTFTVFPLERACNGIQVLQVPLPESRVLNFPPSPAATLRSGVMTAYYVELRAPVGLDAPLGSPRVFLVAAGDLREARQRGNPNWLIDTTPETRQVSDAHLTVGKTYSDPAPNGPKITVVSADATKAVIQVQLGTTAPTGAGMGTCSDMTPFAGPGPSECNAAPTAPPGTPTPDAGPVTTPDASAPAPDMGGGPNPPTNPPGNPPTNPPDAGTMPRPMMPPTGGAADAGAAPPPGPVPSGCSCRVGGTDAAPAGLAFVALAMLGLLVRRRRR